VPKCPKCGKEIDHLHYYAYELLTANFSVSDDGGFEYSDWDSLGDVKGLPEYRCPECSATLFKSQSEAIKFLKSHS
jgi:DNA-directed RNA polymerase subunit RPC12/RpoP